MAGVMIKINGINVSSNKEQTILDAAIENGIHVPTLCFLRNCCGVAECRMCVVEVKGKQKPVAACGTTVEEGMEIYTDTERVREYRRRSLELMCLEHRMDCEYCSRYSDCEFHALIREMGMDDRKYARYARSSVIDESKAGFGFDSSKCILCRRCVEECKKQGMNILTVLNRGSNAHVGPYTMLADTDCIQCGQCLAVCPTGALYERNDMMTLWNALEKKLDVVMILTPEVGSTIGECFGEVVGSDCTSKLAGVLGRIGIKKLYSANTGNDTEVKGTPTISSECPAVTELIRRRYPTLEKYVSSQKPSLTQSVEIVRKLHSHAFVVAVGPCTAGKSVGFGADLYMTVPELAAFIKRGCVSRFTTMDVWRNTPGAPLDEISCACNEDAADDVTIEGMGATIDVLEQIITGEALPGYYRLWACEGGCVMGGGTPRLAAWQRNFGIQRSK